MSDSSKKENQKPHTRIGEWGIGSETLTYLGTFGGEHVVVERQPWHAQSPRKQQRQRQRQALSKPD